MKRLVLTAGLALLVGVAAGFHIHAADASVSVEAAKVTPVFSPGQSAPELLRLIGSAQNRLDVVLYQFSYTPLSDALCEAVDRRVPVRLLLDPQIDSNVFTAEKLAACGVSVRWSSRQYSSTHAKFMAVDGKTVFVGSTNWSRHAMDLNREAAVTIENPEVANSFESVFESDWNIGEPWKP